MERANLSRPGRKDFSAAKGRTARGPAAGLTDNRPASVAQRTLSQVIHQGAQAAAGWASGRCLQASPRMVAQRRQLAALSAETASPEGRAEPASRAPSPTEPGHGLPASLKAGIEALSGMPMDAVKVHYDSSRPAQFGALAYAQGSDIHLAPGQEPHLPHEAWHVVQQAQGRVQPTQWLKEDTPVNGDAGLEQEADVMGARAADVGRRGAAPGNDRWLVAASSAAAPVARPVQAKFRLDAEQARRAAHPAEGTRFHRMVKGEHNYLETAADKSVARLEAAQDLPPLNVSDDGHMAVEATADTPRVMFIEAGDIAPTNEALTQAGSSFRLEGQGHTLSVPALDNSIHTLVAALPVNLVGQSKGLSMTAPQQCIEMAESVISQKKGDAYREYLLGVAQDNLPSVNREAIGKTLAAAVGQYAMAKRTGASREAQEQAAKQASIVANQPPQVPRAMVDAALVEIELKSEKLECAAGLSRAFKAYNQDRGQTVFSDSRPDGGKLTLTIYDTALQSAAAYLPVLARPAFSGFIKKSFWLSTPKIRHLMTTPVVESDETWKPKLSQAVARKEDSLIETLEGLSGNELETALRELGLNEHAKIGIGQAFGVTAATKSTAAKMKFPYHWAGVIAQRGDDVVTLENYARGEGSTVDNDARWYLQMYGPERKVDVSAEGAVAHDRDVAADYWKQGTFHAAWKGEFSGVGAVPFTVGVGTKKTVHV